MPDTAVRTTVGQMSIPPDTWIWVLVLRIKHRFGISTKTIVYRLKELNRVTEKSSNTYIQKIKTHYKQINFGELDASRRIKEKTNSCHGRGAEIRYELNVLLRRRLHGN